MSNFSGIFSSPGNFFPTDLFSLCEEKKKIIQAFYNKSPFLLAAEFLPPPPPPFPPCYPFLHYTGTSIFIVFFFFVSKLFSSLLPFPKHSVFLKKKENLSPNIFFKLKQNSNSRFFFFSSRRKV